MNGRARIVALALATPFSACIYDHTWSPLQTDFHQTPVFTGKLETGAGDVKHLSIPVVYTDLDFMWSSNAIGDVAKREGLEELYYADLERLSVLGIWNQYTVHVYGKPYPDKR